FRTVRPVIAGKEGCVSCHNGIQTSGPKWQLGDVMGAYVLDVPAAAFLAGLRKQSTILGVLVFIATLAGAMILMRIQHHISGAKVEAEQARQKEALEAEARRQAEELAAARQAAEAKSRHLADQLAGKNGELADVNGALEQKLRELERAQDELVKKGKLAQLGQLTATVAHEIRNPLGAVRTSSFIIERKTKDLDLDIDKPMERIKHGIARCDHIITELLDFTRTRSLDLGSHHVDNWLVGLVREQSTQLPEQVAVKCHLGLGDIEAGFDTDHMERVFINLISNSSEAMVGKAEKPNENPVANPQIVISSRLTDRGIEISVADNGPGICAADMKRVLEPLFTTKSFGVGLGLPAVDKILREHGGGLEIDGGEGRGATFTAWFPLHKQADVAA
ncbi:MAG: ATP-binding protein, partial [Aestuariivirgaceae bacterium]